MKQAAKIIFAQSKHRTIQSIIAREKYLLERATFCARDKSRLLPTDTLFTRGMLAREISYSLTFQQLDSRN